MMRNFYRSVMHIRLLCNSLTLAQWKKVNRRAVADVA